MGGNPSHFDLGREIHMVGFITKLIQEFLTCFLLIIIINVFIIYDIFLKIMAIINFGAHIKLFINRTY